MQQKQQTSLQLINVLVLRIIIIYIILILCLCIKINLENIVNTSGFTRLYLHTNTVQKDKRDVQLIEYKNIHLINSIIIYMHPLV